MSNLTHIFNIVVKHLVNEVNEIYESETTKHIASYIDTMHDNDDYIIKRFYETFSNAKDEIKNVDSFMSVLKLEVPGHVLSLGDIFHDKFSDEESKLTQIFTSVVLVALATLVSDEGTRKRVEEVRDDMVQKIFDGEITFENAASYFVLNYGIESKVADIVGKALQTYKSELDSGFKNIKLKELIG